MKFKWNPVLSPTFELNGKDVILMTKLIEKETKKRIEALEAALFFENDLYVKGDTTMNR